MFLNRTVSIIDIKYWMDIYIEWILKKSDTAI